MRNVLSWVITQRVVAISSRRFGTTYRSYLLGRDFGFLIPKMGSTDCPETSARNYHYSLRNSPEERSSQFLYVCAHRVLQMIFHPSSKTTQHLCLLLARKTGQDMCTHMGWAKLVERLFKAGWINALPSSDDLGRAERSFNGLLLVGYTNGPC